MTTGSRPQAELPRSHGLAQGSALAPPAPGQFTRLFPELPALEIDPATLHAMGGGGGACDGGDAADPESGIAAGWPFFGQLVAHDITADRSPLTHRADADVANFRQPRPDLECLYGGGPSGSPYLYDRTDPAKLLVGAAGIDVPRNAQDLALVGDARNDAHLLVNQLHVALLHAHNRLVDRLRAEGAPPASVFTEARRRLVWHYQWILLHEFLPLLVGRDLANNVLATGASLGSLATTPCLSFEFSDAAYRYGHGQIREHYRINAGSARLRMFPDLMGFRTVDPSRAVQWDMFFDRPGRPPAQRARRMNGRLAASLIRLPVEITGEVEDPAFASLAGRDLQRGLATGLPSGEAVARALGVAPLDAREIGLSGWKGETPLWFYILREADVRGAGDRLGPVGGRIVAETLVAIVDRDPESFRAVDPTWRPAPASDGGLAGLAELIAGD